MRVHFHLAWFELANIRTLKSLVQSGQWRGRGSWPREAKQASGHLQQTFCLAAGEALRRPEGACALMLAKRSFLNGNGVEEEDDLWIG